MQFCFQRSHNPDFGPNYLFQANLDSTERWIYKENVDRSWPLVSLVGATVIIMISFNSLPSNVQSGSFSFGANIKNVDNFVFLNLDNSCVSTISVGMQYALSQVY